VSCKQAQATRNQKQKQVAVQNKYVLVEIKVAVSAFRNNTKFGRQSVRSQLAVMRNADITRSNDL
jgi:hypothetical protein